MHKSVCWPNDKDYLDGATEVRLPSTALLQAYWDTDILDVNGVAPGSIISVSDDFQVRFRLELRGPAWQCMGGDWQFDVQFEGLGKADEFALSERLTPGALTVAAWKGCDRTCIEHNVIVPAGTVKAGLYELGAEMQLYCCGRPAAVVGHEALEEYQWYLP